MINQTILAETIACKAPKMQWALADNSKFQGVKTSEEIQIHCPRCQAQKVVCCHVESTLPGEYINEFCHICLNDKCDYSEHTETEGGTSIKYHSICPYCSRVVCSECGSLKVRCHNKYYTTGDDMGHVQWKHKCNDCGHVDTSYYQMACYGYDNDYVCPFPNCENTFRS